MIIFASSSKDTYITNKLIDSLEAVSGNVGRAGTLDLFKLYDESSTITGSFELSRILMKFDLSKISLLSSSSIKLNDESFQARLLLKNIWTGQPVPSNFTIEVFPLAKSFAEGLGRDVISFADVDAANFLSSSNGVLWNITGCKAGGTLGAANLDYFVSGNLQDGNGLVFLGSSQAFQDGYEDLSVDVTKIVSATLVGTIPDNGFRISFIANEETDEVTRFVKRFASRHVREQELKPQIKVDCDDSIVDFHSSSFFDISNNLVLTNLVRGHYVNFVSGSSFTEITGSNCMLVRLSTGSFSHYVTASQIKNSSPIAGFYSASFIISSHSTSMIAATGTLGGAITASGSIKFDEVWSSLDKSVVFYSGSLRVNASQGKIGSVASRKLRVTLKTMPETITKGDSFQLSAQFYDDNEQGTSAKFAFNPSPLAIDNCKVRLRNKQSNKLLFDFDSPGSKMSIDSSFCNFTIYTDALPVGVSFTPEFQISLDGDTVILTAKSRSFMVNE
jgi:hypothetical protein